MTVLANSLTLCCFCNNVSVETVNQSIQSGAKSFDAVYDSCGAGVGPCGGTCRKKIKQLLGAVANASDLVSTAVGSQTNHSAKNDAPSIPDEMLKAISLFNRRYYWEAHEVLEEIWLEERSSIRLLYQAIIQAAAAYYHVLNANPKGVLKLSADSLEKLQKYQPSHWGLDLSSLAKSLEDYQKQAKDILSQSRSGFNYDTLPRLLFLESGELL